MRSRGLTITDPAAAESCLERIGYYRLSAYWYPFRERSVVRDTSRSSGASVGDDFTPGTTFQQVMALYVFDRQLRLLFLDALERVEIALRVDVALLLGARDPWAHRDSAHLHGQFAKVIDPKSKEIPHQKWLAKLDRKFALSDEEFVKHFKRNYPGENPPIWIAIELFDFGMLSVLFNGLRYADREQLAGKYHLPRPDLLASWLRNLNHIRNIYAHHSRLWNKSPADQIAPPRVGEHPLLDHLACDEKALVRLYASAAALQFLLRTIHTASSCGQRLKSHCAGFPSSPVIKLEQAGFMPGWEGLALWNGMTDPLPS